MIARADADIGNCDLAPGEVGEVILRAPQLMKRYWQNEAETSHSLWPAGAGAPWLFTGHLGYLDDDGYHFIVDRKKDPGVLPRANGTVQGAGAHRVPAHAAA